MFVELLSFAVVVANGREEESVLAEDISVVRICFEELFIEFFGVIMIMRNFLLDEEGAVAEGISIVEVDGE